MPLLKREGGELDNLVLVHMALELRLEHAASLVVGPGETPPSLSRDDFCKLALIAYDDVTKRVARVRDHYTKDPL